MALTKEEEIKMSLTNWIRRQQIGTTNQERYTTEREYNASIYITSQLKTERTGGNDQ